MKKHLIFAAVASALLLGGVGQAKAGLVVYTDLSSWQAAAGPSTLENFNAASPFNTTGSFGPLSFNGFTLSGDGNGNNIGIHTGAVSSTGPNYPIPAQFLGQNFVSWGNQQGGTIGSITITFSTPTNAFAFDWFNTDFSDQYQITFQPAGTFETNPPFTMASGPASSGFFGITSSTLLTSATITDVTNGGYISDEGFDNIRLGSPTSAVPEPSSLVLLGISISSLAGYGWRRRKAALAA